MRWFRMPFLVLAAFAFVSDSFAQDEGPTEEDLVIRLKKLKIEMGDNELRTLQKECFNAEIDVVQGLMGRLRHGKDLIPFVLESQQRLAVAGLEAISEPKSRIAMLEECVRIAKIAHLEIKGQFEAGKARLWEEAYARSMKATMEIRLLREKEMRRRP